MDKTEGHYAKRSDPGTERKTMHSLIYVCNTEIPDRMVITGDVMGRVHEKRKDADYKVEDFG